MSVKEVIQELIDKKITVHVENGNLKIRSSNKNTVSDELLTKIKHNKQLIIDYLESNNRDNTVEKKTTNHNMVDLRPLEFGLFYFGNSGCEEEGYRLLLEGAKYADKNGYCAIWTPERHFHDFGGAYPCPSVLGAAVAAVTNNVNIRAGSIVVPLHNPIRIAEEWSVIDNLSQGRAGIACASGWQANDFVISPDSWSERHKIMYNRIEIINKLWDGKSIKLEDGNGFLKDTKVFPKPVQKKLPMWITTAGNIDTFITAGKLGLKVLTHMLGTTLEELAPQIKAYRRVYKENNHKDGEDKVVLMLHTFLEEKISETHRKAKKPFTDYLRTSLDLVKHMAVSMGEDLELEKVTNEDLETMLDHAYSRYTSEASLIGTVECRLPFLKKLSEIGVDEIASLIDFGVDTDDAIKNLKNLTELKNAYNSELMSKECFS